MQNDDYFAKRVQPMKWASDCSQGEASVFCERNPGFSPKSKEPAKRAKEASRPTVFRPLRGLVRFLHLPRVPQNALHAWLGPGLQSAAYFVGFGPNTHPFDCRISCGISAALH